MSAWLDYVFCRLAYECKRLCLVLGPAVMAIGVVQHRPSRVAAGGVGLAIGLWARSRRNACPLPPRRSDLEEAKRRSRPTPP